MRWLQNISFSNSTQPCAGSSASSSPAVRNDHSPSPSPSPSPNGVRLGPRLTRQRNLRYLSDKEIDGALQFPPPSPDGDTPATAAVTAHPLPLPGLPVLCRKKEGFSGSSSVRGDCPLPSPEEAGVNRDRGGDALVSSAPFGCILVNQDGKEIMEHPDARPSRTVCRGVSCVEKSGGNFKLNVPSRSVPTSPFSSPILSPQTMASGDFLPHYYITPKGNNIWSAPEIPGGMSSPCSSETANCSAESSPLPSPHVRSPHPNSKNLGGSVSPLYHKLAIETSTSHREANIHVGVHPLPLPPGAALPSTSTSNIQVAIKPEPLPLKRQWKKGKLIGRGTFGSVYVASNRETGALCAMKEVELLPDDPQSAECMKQLEQEIKVLSRLKHPNIVQYYGSEIVEERFYIYLEYVHPGSINKYIREHCGAITELVVRNFTRHILSGLAYLHSKKTIHRDIKGANLLVDASGIVKLADFGMAKHLTGQAADLSLKGSPYWMAPELIHSVMQKDNSLEHALAVDIWSLGCTILEMLTGKPPWSEFEGAAAMFKAMNNSPPIPETVSPEGKDFLQCCFRRDPAERSSAAMLLEHAFLRNLLQPDVPSRTQPPNGKRMDISRNPETCRRKIIDQLPVLPTAAQSAKLKAVLDSESGQQTHYETMDLMGMPRYSPRSILEMPPTLSPPHSDGPTNCPSSSANPPCSVINKAKKNRTSR